MSADDWVCCPICKKRSIDFIDKQYGKISVDEFKLLSRLRDLYVSGSGYINKEFSANELEILYALQTKLDFQFIPETESGDELIETVRVDEEIVLTEEDTLYVNISYSCQNCGSEWLVKNTFLKGLNKIKKVVGE